MFYRAGLIEIFGRGINKIRKGFEDAGMEMPLFKEEECGLTVTFNRRNTVNTIPKQSATGQLQDNYRTTTGQLQNLYNLLGESELSLKELMQLVNLKGRDNFLKNHLYPAIEAGLIEPIYPDQPNHPRQKYRRKQNR